MSTSITRRDFLAFSATAGAAAFALPGLHGASTDVALKKALIRGLPTAEMLEPLRNAGFQGIECNAWEVPPATCEKARQAAEAAEMSIHSVLRGWCNVNHSDPDKVAEDVESVKTALQTAEILGADAVLLVPCKIGGGPKPWEFDYEFDPETLMVTRVVKGDNAPYETYIQEQNRATQATQQAVAQLLPEAEKRGVVIALENVWNNLWVKPDFFAALVASFKSRWVQAYLDLGNHVKYAATPEWIRALDGMIAKCHVKDFQLNPDGKGGKFVDIRDGSNDWTEIRSALRDVGYTGWLTIEGSGGLPIQEQSRRLDLIIEGK